MLLRGISAFLLYSSAAALAVLSTSKKDLERAAELAVERAAEKAAERAVEKALNSGNSSTITVTVKESYSNARKTAEEAAAPGSESTRPHDPTLHDSRYAYEPLYKVTASEEDAGYDGERQWEENRSAEYEGSSEPSVDNVEQGGDPSTTSTPIQDSDSDNYEAELDITADLDSLEISSDASFRGNFGLKSTSDARTKTFSRSYSLPKSDIEEMKIDVDDNEAARILKMYATQLQSDGWSSGKQKGWIRHRPLWDDGKVGRIDREFWKGFHDMSLGDSTFGNDRSYEERQLGDASNHLSPTAMTTVDMTAVDHLPIYQMSHRQVDAPRQPMYTYTSKSEANRGRPMKFFLTIPVARPPTHKLQNGLDGNIIESMKYYKKPIAGRHQLSSKRLLNRSYGIESGGLFFYANKNAAPQTEQQAHAKASIYRSIIKIPNRILNI